MPPSRRAFLHASAASVFALSAATYTAAAHQPNDRLRLAVMGVHGRGRQLAQGFAKQENCQVVAICEVDDAAIGPAAKAVENISKSAPKVEKDIRKLLGWKDIDALVIATPDHWHALATVWACQHGKHVYVEKPVSHNAIEGQRMVEAARKHSRIVQYGCQRRSAVHFQHAVEFLRSGKLGKIPFARAWIAGDRKTIGRKPDGPVPAGVDYDLWLGPAAQRPFNPNRFHYNWHWNWDYGTGELGNNGIHGLDICRWGLNVDFPTRITCGGGKYFYDDDQETPDTQLATFDFPSCAIAWEHRIWSKTGMMGESWGVAFYGEKGTLIFDKNGWHVELGDKGVEASEKPSGDMDGGHYQNFLDCIRTGKKPNAEIEDGHKSTLLCHLGNIAYRTGRTLRFDGTSQKILDDAEASKLMGRSYRKGFELPAV
jgi:predicted dehydrogenase